MIRQREPIKRGKRPNARRPGPPRRTSAEKNELYKAWVRDRKCLACLKVSSYEEVRRGSDPHHTRRNGLSSKGDDSSCVPLCREHHEEIGLIGTPRFEAKYQVNMDDEAKLHYGLYVLVGRVN